MSTLVALFQAKDPLSKSGYRWWTHERMNPSVLQVPSAIERGWQKKGVKLSHQSEDMHEWQDVKWALHVLAMVKT